MKNQFYILAILVLLTGCNGKQVGDTKDAEPTSPDQIQKSNMNVADQPPQQIEDTDKGEIAKSDEVIALVRAWVHSAISEKSKEEEDTIRQISEFGESATKEIVELLESPERLPVGKEERKEGYLLSLLVMLGRDEYIPKLVVLQTDTEWWPRFPPSTSPLRPIPKDSWKLTIVTRTLIAVGKRGIPVLAEELSKGNRVSKILVAYVLGKVGAHEALPHIGACLAKTKESENTMLRETCVWAVAAIVAPEDPRNAEVILDSIIRGAPVPEYLQDTPYVEELSEWWKQNKAGACRRVDPFQRER